MRGGPRETDRKAYDEQKTRVGKEVQEVLCRRFPSAKGKIDVATPATIKRYTNNWKGSMEGWMPSGVMSAQSLVKLIRYGILRNNGRNITSNNKKEEVMLLPNIIAMISSLVAVIFLSIAAFKIGGSIGTVLKLLSTGIFFAVFVHAGFELAEVYEIISTETLMPVMGVLLSVGSILFSVAGYIGMKAFE